MSQDMGPRPGGERNYPIQTDVDQRVGVCRDGRQVAMGLLCPHVVAYFFDPQGRWLGREQRDWAQPAPRSGESGPYQIYEPAFEAALARQMGEWHAELGFQARTIRVLSFFDEENRVGVRPLPDHLEGDLEEDEREARAYWIASGSFVWWWAKDYWMSADGEVEST